MRIVKVLSVLAVLLAVATFATAAGPSFVERRRSDVPVSDVFEMVRSSIIKLIRTSRLTINRLVRAAESAN